MGRIAPFDVIVIGGGAAGLTCALVAARRGRRVVLLDHRPRLGDRVAVAGGGGCNFGNRAVQPAHFVSDNSGFLHSPLAAFPAEETVRFLAELGLGTEERGGGRLFCPTGGEAVRRALVSGCRGVGVTFWPDTRVQAVSRVAAGFRVDTSRGVLRALRLVVATGGLARPRLGASDLGYRLAEQFGHRVVPPRPGLVPLVFPAALRGAWADLAGIAVPVSAAVGRYRLRGDLLLTHRGVSGPVVLTLSNRWRPGLPLAIDWWTDRDTAGQPSEGRPGATCRSWLAARLPVRLVDHLVPEPLCRRPVDRLSRAEADALAGAVHNWVVTPAGVEGYDTAEVTLGGVDTRQLDGRTFESRLIPGLHFIGEVLDVTGDLGGYNLHWAWASGHLAAAGLQP